MDLSPPKLRLLFGILIVVLGFAAYANSLPCGFTLDDHLLVEQNKAVTDASGWRDAFTSSYWPPPSGNLYRPLVTLSFWIQARLHGMKPALFHLGNVLIHLAGAWLFFLLAERLSGSLFVGFAAALLHTVHPLTTESVTSAVGRAELLAFAFGIGAVLGFWDAAERGSMRRFTLASALFFCALLSKESAAGFAPVAYLALAAPSEGAAKRFAALRSIRPHAMLFFAVGAYLAIRYAVLGNPVAAQTFHAGFLGNPIFDAPAPARIATALTVLARYLGLFLWPSVLSADYSYNQIPVVQSLLAPQAVFSAMILVALAAVGLWAFFRSRSAFVGAFSFFALIFVSSNLAKPIGTIMAERLVYSPIAGLCLLAAWPVGRLFGHGGKSKVVAWVLVCLIGILASVRTFVRNPDWMSDESLNRSMALTAPHSSKAHYNYGASLAEQGRKEEARREFARTIEIYPDYYDAWAALGDLAFSDNDLNAAHRYLVKALSINKHGYFAIYNMGVLLLRTGDPRAEKYLWTASEKKPLQCEPYSFLGALEASRGNRDKAMALMTKAVSLCPQNKLIRANLDNLRSALAAEP